MNRVKTENGYFFHKYILRKFVIEKYNLQSSFVLDCFHAHGKLWNKLKKDFPEMKLLGIELDKNKQSNFNVLYGDNRRFLKSLDIHKFNIIDLDSYGSPYEQLRILKERNYHGHLFMTFIIQEIGQINYGILESLGYSKKMIKKCPSVFSKNNFEKFKKYLKFLNINSILYITKEGNKNYLYCQI
jgi:hypothetical protein